MISVVIPTLNAEARLPSCLESLVAANMSGLVREVVIADGGSTDDTLKIADAAGAAIVEGSPGRGAQLKRGAEAAKKGRWLLFLHADTVLDATWAQEAEPIVQSAESEGAYVFTLQFDARGFAPRLVAAGAMIRTRLFASPYGDQGLLVSRALYDAVGGFRDMPLFEDVDLFDRIVATRGRQALKTLKSRATTSAERYERDGYLGRIARNFACMAMYRAGVAPAKIAAVYRS
jgi:rSAM/selenodomain-associated transferase 2